MPTTRGPPPPLPLPGPRPFFLLSACCGAAIALTAVSIQHRTCIVKHRHPTAGQHRPAALLLHLSPPSVQGTASAPLNTWSHALSQCRYVLTMGDSLVRTNQQLMKDPNVDMILITYADVEFSNETLRVLRSVGWTLKEVRNAASGSSGCA